MTRPAAARKYGFTLNQVNKLLYYSADMSREDREDTAEWRKSDTRFTYVKYKYKRRGIPDFGDQYGVEITSTSEQMAREIGWIA